MSSYTYTPAKITMTRKVYHRTASGKCWKKNPDEVEVEEITRENYGNRTSRETVRFFNGLFGGTCTARYSYSRFGYTPYRITLVNPSGDERIVERFEIR